MTPKMKQVKGQEISRLMLKVKSIGHSFSTSALLHFPSPNQNYLISIHTSLVDQHNEVWNTGPDASILIKVT